MIQTRFPAVAIGCMVAGALLHPVTEVVAGTTALSGRSATGGGTSDRGRSLSPDFTGVSWTGWLGPERNGWVPYFRPPQPWPKRLSKAWRVKVGPGYGTPLIRNGRIWIHTRQGGDEVVRCIDGKTGSTIWSRRYPVPFKIGGGGEYHGKWPKASPAIAAGKVFTMSITGDLIAWDAATGRQLWKRGFAGRFKKTHPRWGMAASPIVDGRRIIAHFGTDFDGALMALDIETGKVLWSQGRDGPSYSSPLVVEIHGVRQVIDWNERAIVGVEVETGKKLWEFPAKGDFLDQNMPTPVFHKGRILLGAENRGIRGLDPVLENGRWKVYERWHQKRAALNMSTAVINGDLLFGFSHYRKGQFFCLDPRNGKILWKGPGRVGQNVMFLSVPGYVIALINHGTLHVIAARPDRYEVAATYKVANRSWAPPALIKNGFVIKDFEHLTVWLFGENKTGGKR